MKYSYKLRINKQRIRKNGTAALHYQIIVNSEKTTVPLDIAWPADLFDPDSETIAPRTAKDLLHEDYCRLIQRKGSEINEIFIWARLSKVELSVALFHQELANKASRQDFVAYWQREMDDRFAKGKIRRPTYISHKSSLATLKSFRPKLPFNQFTKEFLDDYKAWLLNHTEIKSVNTVWKKLKELRTYCLLAKGAKFLTQYPFEGFKMPTTTSRLDFLNEEEFIILRNHYINDSCADDQRVTLRAFLFACYTGLRISDLMAMTWREMKRNVLIFRPIKRPREMVEMVRIPLHREALLLIPTKKDKLIPTVVEQSMNRTIKVIARELGLDPNISFHWARHTFATRFLHWGGKLEVLQQLLGHKKIETTRIYVHVDESRKRQEVDLMPF